MNRVVGVVALVWSGLAGAATPADAFLARQDVRDLVDPRALSPAARAAWSAGRVSSQEPRFGVPTFLWAQQGAPRPLPGSSPEQAARSYLRAYAELYRAAPSRWAEAELTQVHDLHDGTAVIATFQQRVQGVHVFRDELDVVMTSRLELVALSGYLTPALRPLGPFALTPQSALGSAYLHLTGRALSTEALASRVAEGGYLDWQLPGSRSPARTRPVYFPLPEGVVPGFYVELDLESPFSFVISAVDGAVLYAHDLTVAHDFRVWADPVTKVPWAGPQGGAATPYPNALPSRFVPTPLAQQVVTLEHAGLSTSDPWLLPGATSTRGNNTHAYADWDWPNGYDSSTDLLGFTSSPDSFSYVFDFNVSPEANQSQISAGVVQLFYDVNFLHDWYYDDGFTELAGNAQVQNFGRGGAGNDQLLAEASDWSGRSNANMATPADGRSPRMQMYVFGSYLSPSARDGAADTGVVAHEWGHYISNRIIGNGNGLSSLQAGGLGEGWGDFHAALLLTQADDALVPVNANWQGTYGLGGWAMQPLDPEAYYYGTRRYPLSANLARNPLTFAFIEDGAGLPVSTAPVESWGRYSPNAEVHNTGEVWAVMLWDCYVALLNDSRFTFEQARARMKRYLVAAYKATPLTPTFVEARDALLAVAAANDATDFNSFWAAFARRGLGVRAVAPPRDAAHNSPTVQDFTVGTSVQLVALELDDSRAPCDADGVLDVGEGGLLTVKLRNLGTAPLPGASLAVSSTAPGLSFPSGASVVIPTIAAFGTSVITLPVSLSGSIGVVDAPVRIEVSSTLLTPTTFVASATFRLNYDAQATGATVDAVETTQSAWTLVADPTLDTGSPFHRYEANPTQHWWHGPDPVTTADTALLSPPLQVGSRLKLTFSHRHDFEQVGTELLDGAVIELSTDDGATWVDVGTSAVPAYTGTLTTAQNQGTNPLRGRSAFTGQSDRYPAFLTEVVDLGSTYANQTVRVRFRIGSDDTNSTTARGWELDDLQFEGLLNQPFSRLVADPNSCSNHVPVALPGPDLEADEGVRLILVGSGTDADGDAVTLTWAQLDGPPGVLNGNSFITPEVASDTQVTLQLTASDGRSAATAQQRLLVRNVNRAPTASAPRSLEVQAGETVSVRGSGFDSDGDALTFAWTQVSGPPVTLTGASTATVSFVAPGPGSAVRLELAVRDLVSSSAPAVVDVTVAAAPVTGEPEVPVEPDKPRGCGCASVDPAVLLLALLALHRRTRR